MYVVLHVIFSIFTAIFLNLSCFNDMFIYAYVHIYISNNNGSKPIVFSRQTCTIQIRRDHIHVSFHVNEKYLKTKQSYTPARI